MNPKRQACIVGVGQTEFTRHGGIMNRSQFQVAAEAVLSALADAGLSPEDIDGFASFSNDANEAALMQVALCVPQLRWSSMVWGGICLTSGM
jgi:acetyl-CoA acetyltransferase